MTRVKGAVHAIKRRRKILSRTKGYRNARKSKEREAKQAMIRAGQHAFAHRRTKKRDFRALWQMKVNAGARAHSLTYSTFIKALKDKSVGLNRKMLAELAEHRPATFERIVNHVAQTK